MERVKSVFAPIRRHELAFVCAIAWLAFIAIPLSLGSIGISWDALNHHIYLGWTAEHGRFDRDFLPASYQSYQFPYLYWPVYRLSVSGLSGAWAGVVLATLHMVVVPPVWIVARLCMPGDEWFDISMRTLGVALAFATGIILSMFDSTSNDLMAAAPLVWAIALALVRTGSPKPAWLTSNRAVLLSGFLAGMSVAFKLSNGPIAVLLPVLWLFTGDTWRERVGRVAAGGVAATLGFMVTYGYWGWQLWEHFGNPIYPFYDPWFAGLRPRVG